MKRHFLALVIFSFCSDLFSSWPNDADKCLLLATMHGIVSVWAIADAARFFSSSPEKFTLLTMIAAVNIERCAWYGIHLFPRRQLRRSKLKRKKQEDKNTDESRATIGDLQTFFEQVARRRASGKNISFDEVRSSVLQRWRLEDACKTRLNVNDRRSAHDAYSPSSPLEVTEWRSCWDDSVMGEYQLESQPNVRQWRNEAILYPDLTLPKHWSQDQCAEYEALMKKPHSLTFRD